MALVDYFLKLDGIEGEAQDHKHKGEIELQSYSFGGHQQGTHMSGGGGGAGKVSLQDMSITMFVNKASPKLFLDCCTGEHIPKAVLIARKAGKAQQEFLKITLTDILVSSYSSHGPHGGEIMQVEQITLNFAKVEIEYKEQKADGTLGAATKVGWDAKANKKV